MDYACNTELGQSGEREVVCSYWVLVHSPCYGMLLMLVDKFNNYGERVGSLCLSSSLASVCEEKIVGVDIASSIIITSLLLCHYDTRIIILSPGSLCSGTSHCLQICFSFSTAHLVISGSFSVSIIMSPDYL